MQNYLTTEGTATGEYTEKRSRFIANIFHCESEDEVTGIISDTKTKYWDARHNVYAYALKNNAVSRFSDDGEPHGTAGKPVLDVINGSGLTDVLIIVTRYFGGVLLGTGGLVRAYSKAAAEAVKSAKTVEMRYCRCFKTVCEYSEHSQLLSLINLYGGIAENTVFTDKVILNFGIPETNCEIFEKKLSETFSARINITETSGKFTPFQKNIK